MTIILFRGVAQPSVRWDKQRSAALDAGGFGEAYDFRKFGFQFQKWGLEEALSFWSPVVIFTWQLDILISKLWFANHLDMGDVYVWPVPGWSFVCLLTNYELYMSNKT